MLYNLASTFIEKVYPSLEFDQAWGKYSENYYLPNQMVLVNHFSRWGSSDTQELRDKGIGWLAGIRQNLRLLSKKLWIKKSFYKQAILNYESF